MSIRPFGLKDKSKIDLTFSKLTKDKMIVNNTILSYRQVKNPYEYF